MHISRGNYIRNQANTAYIVVTTFLHLLNKLCVDSDRKAVFRTQIRT
jgi:hypothetical protein